MASGDPQRILITGGAGFVGVNLVAHLARPGGPAITVLDDESLGDRRRLDGHDVTFVRGDVRDPALLQRIVPGHDAVVHLAADTRVMDSIADPERSFEVNALGSLRVLQACRAHGVARMVAASSGGTVLGEAPAPVHEGLPARPLSPYGASKLAMEGYLSAYAGAYGLSTAALRFSNVYGPHSDHKGSVVAHVFKRLLAGQDLVVYGDGSQVRDYLYVADLVDGLARAIASPATGVYQLGSGRPTTVHQLLAAIAGATGRTQLPVRYADPRPGEVHTTWCRIDAARAAFGFAPATPLEAGLRRTWRWFQAHGGG